MAKRNLRNLRLRAIAAVDNPCQEGAKAMIIKRRDPAVEAAFVAKYICEDDGAHTFAEVLADNKFSQEIWPYTDALTQSIRSIVGDKSLTGGDRESQINESVGEFLAAVRSISPETATKLSGLIRKEQDMPKTLEQLEKEVGELTGQLTSATALATTEKARADTAEGNLATVTAERDAAKADGGELATIKAELATAQAALKAATDETIQVGGEEIRKSEVGDANFKLAKTLADERTTAQLEKRAESEFAHVVGTPAEKALVLKVIDGKGEDDPTRKALTAVLTAAEKMAKLGFDRLGTTGGQTETGKAATEAFTTKVAEIRKSNPDMKESDAMEKARAEHPDLFEAYQNGGAEAQASN